MLTTVSVPSRPRGWEKSQMGQGPERSIKSRAQPFSDHTISIDLPEEEGPDLFSTNLSSKIIMQINIKSNGHPSLSRHMIRHLISPHPVLLLN